VRFQERVVERQQPAQELGLAEPDELGLLPVDALAVVLELRLEPQQLVQELPALGLSLSRLGAERLLRPGAALARRRLFGPARPAGPRTGCSVCSIGPAGNINLFPPRKRPGNDLAHEIHQGDHPGVLHVLGA